MVSAFQSEQIGILKLSAKDVIEINRKRRRAKKRRLKYFHEYEDGCFYGLHIFEYGKNREGYWDGDDMCEHTDEMADADEAQH